MFLTLRASTSRAVVPLRHFTTSVRALEKAPLRASAETPNPTDLLAKIGRNAEKRLAAQAESWEGLSEVWQKGGKAMADAGLSVKDRRYILWAFSRYSQGALPSEFVQTPKPAKKFRGWGPRVQHGVRVK